MDYPPRVSETPKPKPKADPRKVQVLAELLREAPRTYDELAQNSLLELSRRSLQDYLERHLPAAGYEVQRGRTPGRAKATFFLDNRSADEDPNAVNRAALALARGVLAGLFPLEGTQLDRLSRRAPSRVLAFASGVAEYQQHHMQALLKWINAAEQDPPRALMIRYDAARDGGKHREPPRPRLVWPLGVVLREGRRIYLQALVEPAASLEDARNFALERVYSGPRDCGVWHADAAHQVPTDFLRALRPRPQDLVHAPFGLIRPNVSDEPVDVRVRFDASQAPYVRGRKWHARQSEKTLADGALELSFGPVDCREAVGWCSQWFDGVTVLGDDTFRARYERSLETRLAAQRAPQRPARANR